MFRVVWIRKNFFRILIRGSVILSYGSGSMLPVNSHTDPSGSYLDIFVAIEKKILYCVIENNRYNID